LTKGDADSAITAILASWLRTFRVMAEGQEVCANVRKSRYI